MLPPPKKTEIASQTRSNFCLFFEPSQDGYLYCAGNRASVRFGLSSKLVENFLRDRNAHFLFAFRTRAANFFFIHAYLSSFGRPIPFCTSYLSSARSLYRSYSNPPHSNPAILELHIAAPVCLIAWRRLFAGGTIGRVFDTHPSSNADGDDHRIVYRTMRMAALSLSFLHFWRGLLRRLACGSTPAPVQRPPL